MEIISIINKHESIYYELSIINKLYNKIPIIPLTLNEDEFEQSIGSKMLYVNKRYNKIYKYLNKMFVTNAYSISPQYILSTKTKKLIPFSTDLSWKNDVFETKDGILTDRYFNTCYIKECQIKSAGYIPFDTIKLKGIKVEIEKFISIMTIDWKNSNLVRLSNLYDIGWKKIIPLKIKILMILQLKIIIVILNIYLLFLIRKIILL